MQLTAFEIAEVAHEANRALQRIQLDHGATGVPVAAPWREFREQDGVVNGVETALSGASPEELHEAWCAHKRREGWTHGPVKNSDAKTHPCLVDYDELPEEQRVKDDLFGAIVGALGDVAPIEPVDLADRHPDVADLMRWLTPNPQLAPGMPRATAEFVHSIAQTIVRNVEDGPELAEGLRKLLEAKDCLVRASLAP